MGRRPGTFRRGSQTRGALCLWQPAAAAVADQLYGQPPLLAAQVSTRAQQYVDSITRRVLREGRWLPLRPVVADPQAQSLDGVLVDQVSHSQSAVLGPVLLAHHAWKELDLPAALSGLGFNPTQQALAAAAVINRLVEPLSEQALAEWLAGTALPETFWARGFSRGIPTASIMSVTRCYASR